MNDKLSEKKQFIASSHLKIYLLILSLLTAVFFLLFDISITQRLYIVNQKTNEVYLTADVSPGDKLTYGWIHSLEQIPWIEDYHVLENNHLMLDRITLVGFGAGIPHNKGKVTRIDDGRIIMEEINEDFEEILWIHSQTATQYIGLNERRIIEGRDLPHHELLKLRIEKRLKICRRSQ